MFIYIQYVNSAVYFYKSVPLFILQCSAVEKHFTYGVKEFGSVRGADKIKAEIYARGPVSCGIDATSELEQYTGGIFSQFKLLVMINHELSVSVVV